MPPDTPSHVLEGGALTQPSSLVLRPRAPSPLAESAADIREGVQRWRLWTQMGWSDIRQRYRRSLLGPFWLTLSMAVMVTTLGVLFSGIYKIGLADFLPYLTIGFVVWAFVASCISEGCSAFIDAEGYIKQIRLPYSIFVFRIIWRNIVIMMHNALVYVGVTLIYGHWPGEALLLVVPALLLLILNAGWIGLIAGTLCARFRDVPLVVASLLQIVFFLTPIIWKPDLVGNRMWLVHYNPFHHFVEVIRAPLLGQVPGALSWAVCAGVTVVGWTAMLLFFGRFRRRVPYWL